jgi:exonuclease SbcC
MKILAVRGSNIASLAGPFSLDFASGPLSQTGLFAITGPTGAGKSTLLDAICLALFDETPRLSTDGGDAKIGHAHENGHPDETIQSDDPRGLLTRGATAGYAEVDFVGRDGHRYRARWSVQRARKSGLLQPQKLSLQYLDTNGPPSQGKRDTLADISDKLGFDFQQFRRSILLAQGEFASFLRAKAKDRGELLERMTRTDLYARISMAAFGRAKETSRTLDELEDRLRSVNVLDDDGRKQLDEQIRVLEETDKAAVVLLKELEDDLAWYDRRRRLAQVALESVASLSTLLQGWAAYEPEAWAPPNLGDAGAVPRFAIGVRQRLTVATKLDAVLGDAARALEEAATESKALEARREQLAKAAHEAEARAATTKSELEELEAWLAANAGTERLAKDWALCNRELQIHADAYAKLAALQKEEDLLGQRRLGAFEAVENAESALALAREELKTARDRCEKAEARQREIPVEDIRTRREAGRSKAALLERTLEVFASYGSVGASLAAAEEAKTDAQTSVASLREARVTLDARVAQAEEDLKRARATLDLSGHRNELVAGQPCPLCGSPDHPFARHDPGAKRLVDEQETAIKVLKRERDGVIDDLAKQEATVKTAAKAVDDGEKKRKVLAAQIEANGKSWAALAGDDEQPLPCVDREDGPTQLAARRAAVEEANRKLDEVLTQYALISKEVAEARREKDTRQANVDKAGKLAEEARALVALLKVEAEKIVQARHAATQAHDSSRLVLDGAFDVDTWRTELLANPKSFVEGCRERVMELGVKRKALEGCKVRLPAEQVDGQAKREQLGKLATDWEAASKKVEERSVKLREHRKARDALFAGHPTDKVERDLLAVENVEAQRCERDRSLAEHEGENKTKRACDALGPALAEERSKSQVTRQQLEVTRSRRAIDDEARRQRDALVPELEQQRASKDRWANLAQLIGSATGAKFRDFAQGVTLRIVLAYANEHLQDLRPRYSLMAVPGQSLEIQVVDHDMGDEVRTISSLSGGETFLVSLALALGLAASGGSVAEVETLFIDEGFGALDEEAMEAAIAVLDTLRATGKTIGVISHVDRLPDILGAHVKVTPAGGGLSTVEVVGA